MRRVRLASVFVFAALAPLRAQWQLTGDAGVSRLQQTGIPSSNALTAGATLDAFGQHGWFRTTALVAFAGSDRVTAQGLVLGSLLGAPNRRARWELSGSLSGFGETSDVPTTSGELMARARFDRSDHGGAIGVGTGATLRSGNSNALLRAQGDAWLRASGEQYVVSLSSVHIGTTTPNQFTFVGTPTVENSPGISYADAAVSWIHERDAIGVHASAGLRAGFHGVARSAEWGAADASIWLNARSALVLSAGRSLDDVVRGVPRTTFVGVALRFTAQPRPAMLRRTPASSTATTAPGARLFVEAIGGGRQRLEVRGVDATRLEVMGDFTDWLPIELEHDGGVWRLERSLSSGLHRVAIRLDGGDWTVPANLPRANDDLGGAFGLITIP